MARNGDEAPWTRQLLIGVGALVAVALMIGGVVSAFALGAAKVSGLDDARPTTTARPSLFIPSGEPTTTVDPYPAPPGGGAASSSPSASPKPARKKPPLLSLQASPSEVSPGERITLTGDYRGHDGVRLQVQRFQGGWVDFPVQATVTGGSYSTYIITSRTGPNRLRVADEPGGRTSRPVTVTVR